MSDTLANDFAWSHSRDRTFNACHRQYWYGYYGHWGGWESDADPDTREIWILKQLQSRQMWIGDLVHRIVGFALNFARQNRELPPERDLYRRLDVTMREEFRSSRDDELRKTGQRVPRLYEHEYGVSLPDVDWKSIHHRGMRAVQNFVRSDVVKKILSVPPSDWMPVERFEAFHVDDVPVSVRLDFAYRDGEILRILDWKTGARPAPPSSRQLAGYALFAREKWKVPLERIRAAEVNLVRNEVAEERLIGEDLENAEGYIRESARSMRAKLDDPARNVATRETFGKVEQLRICRYCNFQSVCLGGVAEDVLRRRRQAAQASRD